MPLITGLGVTVVAPFNVKLLKAVVDEPAIVPTPLKITVPVLLLNVPLLVNMPLSVKLLTVLVRIPLEMVKLFSSTKLTPKASVPAPLFMILLVGAEIVPALNNKEFELVMVMSAFIVVLPEPKPKTLPLVTKLAFIILG